MFSLFYNFRLLLFLELLEPEDYFESTVDFSAEGFTIEIFYRLSDSADSLGPWDLVAIFCEDFLLRVRPLPSIFLFCFDFFDSPRDILIGSSSLF